MGQEEQKKAVKRLEKFYPRWEPISNFNFQLTKGAMVNEQPSGFRMSSKDQADIAMINPRSIGISRLAPYPGWAAFRDQMVQVWKTVWKRPHKPPLIERIGIRYINRLDIPIAKDAPLQLEDYLKVHPQCPPIGGAPFNGYFLQVSSPTHHPYWNTTITSAIVPPPPPLLDHLSIAIDIDVFRTENIPFKDTELWAIVDEARDIKNNIFRLCITQKAEELFD
jgi:uncharacterized protein (TIGR04255 family)